MAVEIKIAFLCFLFFILALTQQVLGSSYSERRALLDLRASLGIRARYWPKKVEPCLNWTGIQCKEGRVTGIHLSGLTRTRFGKLNPRFAVDSLTNFPLLSSFNASGFPLPGPIPEWFGQRLATLQVLDLRFCAIFGSVPESLGNLSGLIALYLSDNSIAGVIPATFGNLNSLSTLDLSRNSLTGWIPSSISRIRNLKSLDLSSNFLSGVIPVELGLVSSLISLKLANNSIGDSIPAQLGNLSSLVELDLGYNLLSGSLPEELGRLRSLHKLMVGNNQLEGSVPANLLQNLSSVEHLVLRSNRFSGTFPDVLGSLPHLVFLDVSGNNLTGALPNISAFLNNDQVVFNFSNNLLYGNLSLGAGSISLDLSSNFLTGMAPAITKSNFTLNCFQSIPNQRATMECLRFYADRAIPFNNADERSRDSNKSKKLKYLLGGTFGGLFFILILGAGLAYMVHKCVKRSATSRGKPDAKSVSQVERGLPPRPSANSPGLGEEFTYEKMLQATNNFSDMNLIKHGHSGDIFHGMLDSGKVVIIKRVQLQLLKNEIYNVELDLFSKIKHPKIIPLIGYCLEHEDEKIFVYRYMPNGDLSSALYRANYLEDNGLQSLDWITRLKIAIGAAEAISYLHHECNPPFVHRDIQASSILLDDKYEVRLGSLSEVCVQGADNKIARMLRLQQTFDKGTSAMSSATSAYDVYCFGKILLGLVTGKLSDDNSDDELENLLSDVNVYEKELVSKIVDQSLIVDDDLLEEIWAVTIVAKSCLNPKPSRRPQMRHILRALENPFRVVREESISSGWLRTNSSRKYWSFALFGSWRQSSSDGAGLPGQTSRKEGISGLKQAGRIGSGGSGTNEYSSSSHKRSSSEIFPAPIDMLDERTRQGSE
ncbi:OLC1v1017975C1 [Oldenlandia corymbosa var. corymbosa]|uniref:OLC1v1017975C1 n=1 Tax=Oldenlandia corymbosa var. corymbosa TaxID=529605 RepID=A0AAV1EAJ6_OLDCO|nr:OLC1v1017975C1 [Oldenlandia corymbosa var. corymbosa]